MFGKLKVFGEVISGRWQDSLRDSRMTPFSVVGDTVQSSATE